MSKILHWGAFALGLAAVAIGAYFSIAGLTEAGGALVAFAQVATAVKLAKVVSAARAVLDLLTHDAATPEVKLAGTTVAAKTLATATGHDSAP